jgi:ion channel
VRILVLAAGLAAIAIVLWDAFETVVLPRTVTRRLRLARVYFKWTWRGWSHLARPVVADGRRERLLAVYGPLSLVGLLAVWAILLVAGFGALHWSIGSRLQTADGARARLADDLYMSGTTFFTLGLGDVHPVGSLARMLTVIEGGLGFGFLALVIAYFPVLYQSFSRREVRLTLLDAWAGSPPAAAEILRRLAEAGDLRSLDGFLKDWEYWCSEVLESHISYPVIAFFRSQHQRQSWVSALATILDVSALVTAAVDGAPSWQAHLTFAIARHAAVDLTQVLHAQPDGGGDRLPDEELARMLRQLESAGLRLRRSSDVAARLRELRRLYEPYLTGIASALLVPMPPWWREKPGTDNWQTSPRREAAHL